MGESFDHRPPRWIRQSRKCCIQLIHNHMVVNYPPMSSANFAVPNFCFLGGWQRPYSWVGHSFPVLCYLFTTRHSPLTTQYSLASYADRLARTQTQDPPSKTEDGAPSA